MSDEIGGVAERLVHEFAELPSIVVLETVCACAGTCESDGAFFVEQAARASLTARQRVALPPVDGSPSALPTPMPGLTVE